MTIQYRKICMVICDPKLVGTEDGNKSIQTTDFDTTILVPWLPRSNPLSNKTKVLPVAVRPLRTYLA